MEEPLQIVSVINQYFNQHETQIESSFKGKNALVTAGPTVEVIDPVRFVSNRSSGKMGFAIATALQKRGANVTLVSGPTQLDDPKGVNVIRVESAKEMFEETLQYYDTQDIVIKAAAVSDYTPSEVLDHKMKKQDGDLTVKFKRTQDILKYLGEHKQDQYLVGFAAETQNIEQYAQDKLKRKNADVIISNNVGDKSIGFNSDENELTMHFKNQDMVNIKKGKKVEIANEILDELETRWQ